MEIIYPNGKVEMVGKGNPFRYTEVTRLYRKPERVVAPSGGDDTKIIQDALDSIAEAENELIKTRVSRKWKWPWRYKSGINEIEIVQAGICRFLEGCYSISKPLLIDSFTTIQGLRAQGNSDVMISLREGARNVSVIDCYLERVKGDKK